METDENILLAIYGNLWPIMVEEAERQKNQDMDPFMKSLSKVFDLAKYIQNEAGIKTRSEFDFEIQDNPSQRVLKTTAMLIRHSKQKVEWKEKSRKKDIKTSATFNLRIRNIAKKLNRIRRNVDEDTFGAYYENDDDDLIDKGSLDYLYDETYEDDELFNNSRFGSFQALFLQAEKNRVRKEREETKLNKNKLK